MNLRQYKKQQRKIMPPRAYQLSFNKEGDRAEAFGRLHPDLLEMHYILDGKIIRKPRSYREIMISFVWFEKYRFVARETIIAGVEVSTVFLGMDHNWGGGEPLLFESMIFAEDKPPIDCNQMRYHTYQAAMAGHHEMCDQARAYVA